jgi:hypothetical protein
MGDGFDDHLADLENFEDKLVDLCYDIVEASYDTENAYYKTFPDSMDGIYAAPKEYVANLDMPTPYDFDNEYFSHAKYRQDIARLANGDLTMFLDEADPTRFDEAIERLVRASEHLQLAVGYEGLSALGDVLAGWQGEAAFNFQHDVIPKVGTSVVYQLLMLEELAAVAKCLQEVVLRCRGDGLGLAQDMLNKVSLDEMKVDWEAVLWVAGSVAAGIATFGALFPVSVATVAGTASVALSTAAGAIGQVTRLSGSQAGERAITGETAYGFIPSAIDQVQNVFGKGIDEVESVMNALKGDLDSDEIDYLAVSKPKVIDGAEMNIVNAEYEEEGYFVESVADLRFAGVVTLPVMAEYFDKAYGEVVNLTYPIASGIGKSYVATTPSMRHLTTAIEVLADAFKDSRDYLYKAGVALTDIADTYYDNEELQQAVMDNFTAQLAEFDAAAFERYAPGSRSPSTDR